MKQNIEIYIQIVLLVTGHDLSAVLRNKVVQVSLFLLNYKLSVESQFSKAS